MKRPDDGAGADEWSVYGDHLESIGDPRGALIGLGADRVALAAYVRDHAVELLGAEVAGVLEILDLTWRHDRLVAVDVRVADYGNRAATAIRSLFRAPSSAAIEAMRIVGVVQPGSVIDVGPAMRAIVAPSRPARCTRLAIVDERAMRSAMLVSPRNRTKRRMRLDPLDAIWKIPDLRELALDVADAHELSFGTIDAPSLRAFALRTLHYADAFGPPAISTALAGARWPNLESLELRLVEPWLAGLPREVDAYALEYERDTRSRDDGELEVIDWSELGPLLDSLGATRLRRLALTSATNMPSLLETLAVARLPASLTELDLSGCTLTDDVRLTPGLVRLVSRLERLVVRDTPLSAGGVARLAALGPEIVHTAGPGARFRFVVGME